jgi:hypothetical protein
MQWLGTDPLGKILNSDSSLNKEKFTYGVRIRARNEIRRMTSEPDLENAEKLRLDKSDTSVPNEADEVHGTNEAPKALDSVVQR